MDAWTKSPIRKINRGWGFISVVALSMGFGIKMYRNSSRLDDVPVEDNKLLPPGSFTGKSDVERRSQYEGAGNSYMVSSYLFLCSPLF